MTLELSLIAGLMIGAEYVQDPEEGAHFIVVDCLFVRILLGWG
jgi:hypothetical protein